MAYTWLQVPGCFADSGALERIKTSPWSQSPPGSVLFTVLVTVSLCPIQCHGCPAGQRYLLIMELFLPLKQCGDKIASSSIFKHSKTLKFLVGAANIWICTPNRYRGQKARFSFSLTMELWALDSLSLHLSGQGVGLNELSTVTFSSHSLLFIIIMHVVSVYFSHSEKKEGFVLAWFHLGMACLFLFSGCFLCSVWHGFDLLSLRLTFLVSGPGLDIIGYVN